MLTLANQSLLVVEDGEDDSGSAATARRSVSLRGIVQGVGFRPFVHALATRLGLAGFVRNRADGVLIEVEGDRTRLAHFVEQLRTRSPPLVRVEALHETEIPLLGERLFRIEESEGPGEPCDRFFASDIGTCADCIRELFDPADRRHRYAFINCARCGPRLTITREAPYDRERTTMAKFVMCEDCKAEFENPRDRRFHAQPIACPACGPQLLAKEGSGRTSELDPLSFARDLLLAGRILAIKGLGGYHLACDATNDVAVRRLRSRKHRDEKPFALMVAEIRSARRLCQVSPTEADLLSSARRPIVLLRRLRAACVAEEVAPNHSTLGIMLPYTPLHHLLARECGDRPLVLTSANRSDEPIAFEDDDALERLRGIADGFLTHDRPIQLRCDDSVLKLVAERSVLLRRSRGYAPEPIRLAFLCPGNILALGGQLKNTFALGRGGHAFLSHHLGDLGDYDAYCAFRDAVAHYRALFAFEPEVIVHDLHPGYATTEYAREIARDGVRLLAVQHHHAHLASCMAENTLSGPVIGVTFDGTGYGTDGSLWGGEFLVGDYASFRRAGHLRTVPLPGAEQGIREPWRMALSHLLDSRAALDGLLGDVSLGAVRIVQQMIDQDINSPRTSSMGRLFDAVAALLGLRARATFEGQAAMELESQASSSDACGSYRFELTQEEDNGALIIDTRPIIRAIVADIRHREPVQHIARRFHCTVSEIVGDVAWRLHEQTGIDDVVLSGGVFANALLLEQVTRRLKSAGLRVHAHSRVPSNDGGLSLGQLAVAAATFQGRP